VVLAEQDRSAWDADLIAEGHDLVRKCLRRKAPGPYQLQAAINAVHTDAATAEETDWRQVVALYDQLLAVAPTDVVRLNRAVAVAELDGPAAGLAIVDALAREGRLDGFHALHVVRAELLHRLGRDDDARDAYTAALALPISEPERAHVERRRQAIAGD
jgi:RNA polymerase sigma-70 factor (ECF subfamily)